MSIAMKTMVLVAVLAAPVVLVAGEVDVICGRCGGCRPRPPVVIRPLPHPLPPPHPPIVIGPMPVHPPIVIRPVPMPLPVSPVVRDGLPCS